MNKNLVTSILSASLIFLSWFLINYLGSEPYRLPSNKDLVIPFLWSCVFIYLHGKNHFYIAINSYAIFLLMLFADKVNFGDVLGAAQISYLLLSIAMVFTFVLVYQDLLAKKPRFASMFSFLITVTLFAIPVFYIIYAINFETVISKEVIYAILQTNLNESLEFTSDYISPAWIIAVSVLAIFVGFLLLKQEKKETLQIERSLLMFMVIMFSTLSYINKDDIRLYSFAENSIKEYLEELTLFNETQEKLKNNKIKFEAEKTEAGETYIVVIGESLNKKHMGLYGYMRDTTPLLTKISQNGGLLVFDNAFSSHTHTMQVLSLSLTEANQLNRKNYYDSLSIINILNKADIDTYWITNQVLHGEWDNLVSVIAHQANHLITLNRSIGKQTTTQEYDGAVISEVNNILSTGGKNSRVIFVHLMGNHGSYCSRYPNEYETFSGELTPSEFGKLSTTSNISRNVNCYDNSVLYNDSVVSSLIKSLEKRNGINGLLYFSDHADDVVSQLGHESSNFTYAMTQIPLIMWFSEQYKKRYQDKYSIIEKHKKALFSNDDIYDTLIGVFNINTERYQAVNDLSSSQYFLEESSAYTMHGKIPYTDKSNYLYQQKNNIAMLTANNQALRVIPHRVNSIGKLMDVWTDGCRAFEIDVLYLGGDGQDHFVIGHNHGVMSGMSFEQFITSISPSEIEKIWVDFKNLTQKNYKKALDRLNRLDEQFSLKEKLIIESGTTGSIFGKFQESGWHISYYVPTGKIVKLIDENKKKEMKVLAKSISEQSMLQKLSAISFDHRLYPFVKYHLEPLLSNDIVYHTRDLSVKLYDSDLNTKLNEKNYYTDDRVKTILLPYKSPFHL